MQEKKISSSNNRFMKISDSLKIAILGLHHAKMRSFLTMLGIIIGIASVIILMSIGSSAQNLIINQVQSIGSNLIFVIPGATKGSRLSSPPSAQGVIIKTLVENDVTALKREPVIEKVAPEVRGQAKVVVGNNDTTVSYQGTNEDFFPVRNFNTVKGTVFTKADVDSLARVAVIGSSISETLFGEKNPIGKTLRLKNITFRVVGVLEEKGIGPMGIDQDNVIIIPITVAQKQMLGIDYYSMMTMQTKDEYDMKFVTARLEKVLRRNHRVTDPDKDDFTIRTQEDALSILGNITSVLTLFLTAIAFISLIVGGIGIMNIMLVSVVERTREIGLRKAVGASNRDILQQFLFESIMLTFLGGIVGIAIGGSVTFLVYLAIINFSTIMWTFSLPLSSVMLAVAVSTVTGLVFGIYPARQAAMKSPIDALRYE